MKKACLLIVLSIFPFFSNAQDETVKKFDSNFAHVVYFWLKNPNDTSDRTKFESSLKTFLKNSNYAKTNFIGLPPKALRDVVDDSFTYNLIVTFESEEAQNAYQTEEPHLLFIDECKDLWERVIVYDAKCIKQ